MTASADRLYNLELHWDHDVRIYRLYVIDNMFLLSIYIQLQMKRINSFSNLMYNESTNNNNIHIQLNININISLPFVVININIVDSISTLYIVKK